jgi:hypothetical protein
VRRGFYPRPSIPRGVKGTNYYPEQEQEENARKQTQQRAHWVAAQNDDVLVEEDLHLAW